MPRLLRLCTLLVFVIILAIPAESSLQNKEALLWVVVGDSRIGVLHHRLGQLGQPISFFLRHEADRSLMLSKAYITRLGGRGNLPFGRVSTVSR